MTEYIKHFRKINCPTTILSIQYSFHAVPTLKDHLDRKDKKITFNRKKLEKKDHEEIIQAISATTQCNNMPDNTNMNKDSSVNYKTTAQNKTQAVANADVPPTSKSTQKTNSILKMNLMLSAKSL